MTHANVRLERTGLPPHPPSPCAIPTFAPLLLLPLRALQVDLEKFSVKPGAAGGPQGPGSEGAAGAATQLVGGGPSVVRACIARLPPGYPRLEVSPVSDDVWGVDGFDT